MVLEADVTGGRFAELLVAGELALLDPSVPVLAPLLEVVVTDAVDGDFALAGMNSQIDMIPLACRPGRIVDIRTLVSDLLLETDGPVGLDGLVELVQPAGFLGVVAVHVVLDLDLGSCLPRCTKFLGNVEHDPAVAALGDLVFQREFKVLVFVRGDDVAGSASGTGQRTVPHLPARTDFWLAVISPTRGGFPIEEQFPAPPTLTLGQLVVFVPGRDIGPQRNQQHDRRQQRELGFEARNTRELEGGQRGILVRKRSCWNPDRYRNRCPC